MIYEVPRIQDGKNRNKNPLVVSSPTNGLEGGRINEEVICAFIVA